MKKIPKQEYTAEFKELAVKRALEVGPSTTSRELGLVEQTVRLCKPVDYEFIQ
jgi:transposase